MTTKSARALEQIRTVFLVLAGLTLLMTLSMLGRGLAARAAEDPLAAARTAFLVLVVLLGAAAVAGRLARRVPARTVLDLDLTEPLQDHAPSDPIAQLAARRRPTLRATVEALERAAEDDRVVGLFARIGTPVGGLADAQEVRDAVAAFRGSGKFALAYAETFGEFSPANAAYYLASGFDEVWMQQSGDVGLVGVASEVPFLKGALSKLGVTPQLDHRQEYKTAKNLFTEESFTPAHRESAERIVESLSDQLVAGVADGRGLERQQVRELVDRGPVLGNEAVQAGLVDRLAYRDEAVQHATQRAGDGAQLLRVPAYVRRAGTPRRRGRGATVAVITGLGPVVHGRGRPRVPSRRAMGSDVVTKAFRQAIDDSKVRAILFRVDSPGGSYVASDAIWRETCRARDAGKPVVVSMGNVAGSGGYFVAMGASRIVAHPGTVTGSIGVVGGKMVLDGLEDKLGLSVDAVEQGRNARLWSLWRQFTPEQWQRLGSWLDRVYDDFVAKVADGRSMPIERVRQVAKGRVWTGADAIDLKLVDALGGYPEALRQTRDLIGVEAGSPLVLRSFPKKPSLRARLSGEADEVDDPLTGAAALAAGAVGRLPAAVAAHLPPDVAAPLAALGRRLGLLDGDGVLSMPRLPIRW